MQSRFYRNTILIKTPSVGYYYSIAELVGIFTCKTKYLLHFSRDSYIPAKFKESTWIMDAIAYMEENPNIVVANPVWNFHYDEAKSEAMRKSADSKFYIGFGFSDQCYLINTEVFKDRIYVYHHPVSDRYPSYGGELFEKRVDSFMRSLKKERLVVKDVSYISKINRPWSYFLEKTGLKDIGR